MKYRIKITTLVNDNNEINNYIPQVKTGWFTPWKTIGCMGKVVPYELDTNREFALVCIDLHNVENSTVKTIKFEYIDKA